MKRTGKRTSEAVGPYERWLKIKGRVNAQRANGKFATADRLRSDKVAYVHRQILDQIADDRRPISERVPEYVLDYDDRGNVIGVKPAK